jgi:N-acetylmuramoyl-L-alanine amidase
MPYIALDSGHGKTTPGKRSFDGSLMEYEFNHDVTDRIKNHLERHGVKVLLTSPNSNVDPILTERCRRANSAKVDLFVSIHANAAGTDWNSAHGWEIYVCANTGKQAQLAKQIHEASIPYLGLQDRGIKTSEFAVLAGTSMPAVLIEHAFYTNREECALLCTNDFREKCAAADAKGILSYFGIKWIDEDALKIVPTPLPELTSTNDILESLGIMGIVPDKKGVSDIIALEPQGRLYWLCRKVLKYIRDNRIDARPEKPVTLYTDENDVAYAIGPDDGCLKIVSDKKGILDDMIDNPKGAIYWVATNAVNYIRQRI